MQIIETKTHNVNTQSLFNEVDEFVVDVLINMVSMSWKSKEHRDELVWLMEDFMNSYQQQTGKITQSEVMCDSRNNKRSDMENGIYHLTILFVQKNCFNTTKIDYVIED